MSDITLISRKIYVMIFDIKSEFKTDQQHPLDICGYNKVEILYTPAASSSSSCRLGGIRGSVSLMKFFNTVATAFT
jgi:hypothetical protein